MVSRCRCGRGIVWFLPESCRLGSDDCAGRGQHRCVEELKEVNKSINRDQRFGRLSECSANSGVEHPLGKGAIGAVGQNDNNATAAALARDGADDSHLAAEKRMVSILDSGDNRQMSSVCGVPPGRERRI